MEFILTFDIGTTSIKAGIFDSNLNPIAFHKEEFKLFMPNSFIVELNPDVYYNKLICCIKNLSEYYHINTKKIRVIIITTQGETLIPVDKNQKALTNSIVWLDSRASSEGEFLTNKFGKNTIYKTTGLPIIDGYTPISKILYIKNKMPEIFSRTFKFLMLEDYIIMRLTGEFATEKSLLSSTGYFDIARDNLWDDILEFVGINNSYIPPIFESGKKIGLVSKEVVDELSVSNNTFVVTGVMDQIACAIGAGNIKEGIIHETTGTALLIGATTCHPDFNNKDKFTIYRHMEYGKYLIFPFCRTAAIILKWFKDEFCDSEKDISTRQQISVYKLLDNLANNSPPLANGLMLFPYFSGLIMSDNEITTRGAFFGIGLDTKKNDFIRAILEGIGYMIKDYIFILESMGIKTEEIISLGGASNSKLWLQIKSNILNKRMVSLPSVEEACFGAACIAAVSMGYFPDISSAIKTQKVFESTNPDPSTVLLYEKGYVRYKQLCSSLQSLF